MLAADNETRRCAGDLVAMDPDGWDALVSLARIFGWQPTPHSVVIGGRRLLAVNGEDAKAFASALALALAWGRTGDQPTGVASHENGALDESLVAWAGELAGLDLLRASADFVELVRCFAGRGSFCVN